MKFIHVTDRTLKEHYCTLCCEPVDSPYIREIGTRLIYCSHPCYRGHVEVAVLAIEYHARQVS